MVRQKKISAHGQILTLFIIILSIIAYSFPRFSDMLVYDRQAIFSGELWRLLTAPLVHFSISHIFWNIVVFSVAGFAINIYGFRNFWLLCGLTTVISSILFLLLLPELEHYGGLSGLATGAVAYFCLCSAYKSRKNRSIWLIIIALMGLKILIETIMGIPVFAQVERIPFRVVPLAHITGFLGAATTVIWVWPNRTPNNGRL